jgi:mannitol/fructose-specific phosphotransferase system IIA component (Ntr-type)
MITEILSKEYIKPEIEATNKKEVIKELLSLLPVKEKEKVFNKILERERIMSTGVGKGIAIPRHIGPDIGKIFLCFGIKKQGIDFNSLDPEKAKFFFLLLAPLKEEEYYVKILSHILEILNKDSFRKSLFEIKKREDFITLFKKSEVKNVHI